MTAPTRETPTSLEEAHANAEEEFGRRLAKHIKKSVYRQEPAPFTREEIHRRHLRDFLAQKFGRKILEVESGYSAETARALVLELSDLWKAITGEELK